MKATCKEKSIDVIKENQYETGAYIASPAFAHYRYSWLRDGTFIAYAMDRVGEHESAVKFYEWCSMVICKYETKARQVIEDMRAGKEINEDLFLHTRYTVDGDEVQEKWGNFQLDGYGTWIWGLGEHIRITGKTKCIEQFQKAIEITIDYLEACWQLPNYDCWEEFSDRVHPASLAAIYGGLTAMAPFFPEREEQILETCAQIRSYVVTKGTENGIFTKSIGHTGIDASLLWLTLPFGLVSVADPIMKQTVEQIEKEIVHGCGVHRYATDVYYGGGQWILLSAWLGWYYSQTGQREKAKDILAWIESKCTEAGLPEQVQDVLLAPEEYDTWVSQAGLPANPLLWSHAMYLVLQDDIENK